MTSLFLFQVESFAKIFDCLSNTVASIGFKNDASQQQPFYNEGRATFNLPRNKKVMEKNH